MSTQSDLYIGEHPVDMTPREAREFLRGQSAFCDCPIHTLFPQRIDELVKPTTLDLKAACELIGTDSYGKPHWTPETIHPHNSVVQAFARHALRALAATEQ